MKTFKIPFKCKSWVKGLYYNIAKFTLLRNRSWEMEDMASQYSKSNFPLMVYKFYKTTFLTTKTAKVNNPSRVRNVQNSRACISFSEYVGDLVYLEPRGSTDMIRRSKCFSKYTAHHEHWELS